jgi:hypothetical protein
MDALMSLDRRPGRSKPSRVVHILLYKYLFGLKTNSSMCTLLMDLVCACFLVSFNWGRFIYQVMCAVCKVESGTVTSNFQARPYDKSPPRDSDAPRETKQNLPEPSVPGFAACPHPLLRNGSG